MAIPKEKSLPLAIGLNLVLPGAGYMYMGRVIVGIGAMVFVSLILVTTGLFFIVPTWLGLNLIMAIDMWMCLTRIKPSSLRQPCASAPIARNRFKFKPRFASIASAR